MLWKVGAGALKTKGGLGRILHCEDSEEFLCPLCRNGVEDTIHLIAFCDGAGQAWRGSMWLIQWERIPCSSPSELVSFIINVDRMLNLEKKFVRAFILNAAIMMDELWHLRNRVVFQDKVVDIGVLILKIKKRYFEHSNAWVESEKYAN